ncbi:MAG: glycine cleavage system protein GcvH [Pseudomonadota bacterium]
MSATPNNLKYTKSHEWVQSNADGTVTVGITDHAQELLGDIVFIELPETGAEYSANQDCAVVESVKAASDIYSPISGKITTVNESLSDSPEQVNQDAYGAGWIFKLQPSNPGELAALLSAADYAALIAAED